MNYNELKRRVKAAAPCLWVSQPVYVQHSPCLYGTLLFLMDDDCKHALVRFNGGHARVSATQVSELIELAHGRGKGEHTMSEIKVGDKVRVVQIVVKEKDTKKHTARRMRYLSGTGEVTCISPRLPSAVHVQLTGCLVTHAFHPTELKALSAPCEQQGSVIFDPVVVENRRLQAENSRYRKRNIKVIEENVRLSNEIEPLRKRVEQLLTANQRQEARYTELKEKYDDIVLADERVPYLRDALTKQFEVNGQLHEQLERNRASRERLERSRKELQEQYEGLIQASANTRVSIRNILDAAQRT